MELNAPREDTNAPGIDLGNVAATWQFVFARHAGPGESLE